MAPVAIHTSDSAGAALDLMATTDFDAIISDIKMPGMDGLALLNVIQELQPHTPTLLITGHGEHDLAVQALRGGAYDFIQKPIDRDYVVASLNRAITMRQLDRQVEEQQAALERHAAALEQAVEERTRELREANRRMDEFLAIAGHELRSPLTSIKGYIQLAQLRLARIVGQEAEAEHLMRARTLLERAEGQTVRLNRMVNELLDVSRVQAGKLELRLAPTDLAAMVRAAVEDQREWAPDRAICLEMTAGPSVPIVADADRLGQVVTNYLTNALKYSPDARPVTVGLEALPAQARVWVRDEGPGLPAAEQERIWERFYRASGIEQQDNSHSGLGLGLHISRIIVEQHHGQVGVESAPGMGSTFWFTLPLESGEYHRRDAAPPLLSAPAYCQRSPRPQAHLAGSPV
jgi:signal transduction histidine kinase